MSRIKISDEELEVLQSLRSHRKLHRQKVILKTNPKKQSPTLGQFISDGVAKTVGPLSSFKAFVSLHGSFLILIMAPRLGMLIHLSD
jgi:hypothetical protein